MSAHPAVLMERIGDVRAAVQHRNDTRRAYAQAETALLDAVHRAQAAGITYDTLSGEVPGTSRPIPTAATDSAASLRRRIGQYRKDRYAQTKPLPFGLDR